MPHGIISRAVIMENKTKPPNKKGKMKHRKAIIVSSILGVILWAAIALWAIPSFGQDNPADAHGAEQMINQPANPATSAIAQDAGLAADMWQVYQIAHGQHGWI